MHGHRSAWTITLDFQGTILQHWPQRRKTPVGVARRARACYAGAQFAHSARLTATLAIPSGAGA